MTICFCNIRYSWKEYWIKMRFLIQISFLFFSSLPIFCLLQIFGSVSLSERILAVVGLISIFTPPSFCVSHFSVEWVDFTVHHRELHPKSAAFIRLSYLCSLSLPLPLLSHGSVRFRVVPIFLSACLGSQLNFFYFLLFWTILYALTRMHANW